MYAQEPKIRWVPRTNLHNNCSSQNRHFSSFRLNFVGMRFDLCSPIVKPKEKIPFNIIFYLYATFDWNFFRFLSNILKCSIFVVFASPFVVVACEKSHLFNWQEKSSWSYKAMNIKKTWLISGKMNPTLEFLQCYNKKRERIGRNFKSRIISSVFLSSWFALHTLKE